MKIHVNGEEVVLEVAPTVRELLRGRGEFVAVAINGECIPRGEQERTLVKDGDRVEILAPIGGG